MAFWQNKLVFINLILTSVAFCCRAEAFIVNFTNPEDGTEVRGVVEIRAEIYRNESLKNKSIKEVDAIFNGFKSSFSNDLIKAIAWHEGNAWKQFNSDGTTFVEPNENGSIDIGIMKINDVGSGLSQSRWDMEKIHNDIEYNINAGLAVLEGKLLWILSVRNKNPERWAKWVEAFDLEGHTEQEIATKFYNTMQKSWTYLDDINTVLKNRPWEVKAPLTLLIDGNLRDQKEMALNESYIFAWDTRPEGRDWHQLFVKAVLDNYNTETKRIVKTENTDQIKVEVVDELGEGEGYISGRKISTWEGFNKKLDWVKWKNITDFKITLTDVVFKNVKYNRKERAVKVYNPHYGNFDGKVKVAVNEMLEDSDRGITPTVIETDFGGAITHELTKTKGSFVYNYGGHEEVYISLILFGEVYLKNSEGQDTIRLSHCFGPGSLGLGANYDPVLGSFVLYIKNEYVDINFSSFETVEAQGVIKIKLPEE